MFKDVICLQLSHTRIQCQAHNTWREAESRGLPEAALSGPTTLMRAPHRPEVTLMIGGDGRAYRTINGGLAWSELSLTQDTASRAQIKSRPQDFKGIITLPGERPLVCLSRPAGVWCSEDSGQYWFKLSDEASGAPVRGLSNIGRQLFTLRSSGVQRLDRIVNRDIPSSAVYFKTNDDQPLPSLRPFLLKIARQMLRDDQLHLRVEGHADSRGTREYNQDLALRRAQSVANVIRSQGVSPRRLSVISYGELRPISRGSSPRALAKNRRVELILSTPMNQREEDKAWRTCSAR